MAELINDNYVGVNYVGVNMEIMEIVEIIGGRYLSVREDALEKVFSNQHRSPK